LPHHQVVIAGLDPASHGRLNDDCHVQSVDAPVRPGTTTEVPLHHLFLNRIG
jgi:hypothetical protein